MDHIMQMRLEKYGKITIQYNKNKARKYARHFVDMVVQKDSISDELMIIKI